MTPFGFYNINKPVGPTSHDVVAQVRRLLGRKVKVGHAGTLDPFASGVLVVCVGPATRLADYVRVAPKRYRAAITLGGTSTTDDIEGDIAATPDVVPPSPDMVKVALEPFVGRIMQAPPAYSAVHAGGERAYKRARRGETVELPPREVIVHELALVQYDYPRLGLDIRCGTGTYIRALARDIGAALGAGGYCSELVRTAVGEFTIGNAVDAAAIDLDADLRSPLLAVADLPRFEVPPEIAPDLLHGKRLPMNRLRCVTEAEMPGSAGEAALVDCQGQLLALGNWLPDVECVQPRKVFVESD